MDFLLLLQPLAEVKGIMGDVAAPSSSTWLFAYLELQQCSGGDRRISMHTYTPSGGRKPGTNENANKVGIKSELMWAELLIYSFR